MICYEEIKNFLLKEMEHFIVLLISQGDDMNEENIRYYY